MMYLCLRTCMFYCFAALVCLSFLQHMELFFHMFRFSGYFAYIYLNVADLKDLVTSV